MKRILAVVLCLSILLSTVAFAEKSEGVNCDCGETHISNCPNNTCLNCGATGGVHADDCPLLPYLANIGNFAEFDALYSNFPIIGIHPSEIPSGNAFSSENIVEFDPASVPTVKIVDVALNSDGGAYWYKIEAVAGIPLPDNFPTEPWVFQNYVGYNDGNSLIIHKPEGGYNIYEQDDEAEPLYGEGESVSVCEICEADPCVCTLEDKVGDSVECTLIGFLNPDLGSYTFYTTSYDAKEISAAICPNYLILTHKVLHKVSGEVLFYQADSMDDDFYFGTLSGSHFAAHGNFSDIVPANGLYATIVNMGSVIAYKDLGVATDTVSIDTAELTDEYIVADFCYSSSLYSWFVKLVPDDNWPANAEGYVWLSAAYLASLSQTPTQQPEKCPVCGEENCETEHEWCEVCEDYDCGKTHVWCDECGEYDCGEEHDQPSDPSTPSDEYIPPTEPVIPEDPDLPDTYDVAIVDQNGNTIDTETGITFAGRKVSLSAWSSLGEDVEYQWQVCYNNANLLWIDIYGATEKGLLVSPAMFRNIVDYYGKTYVRCITTSGRNTEISDPIPVTVEELAHEPVIAAAPRRSFSGIRMMSSAQEPIALAANDDEPEIINSGVQYAIKILWQYGTMSIADTWVAYLTAGQDYVLDVPCPEVLGYVPKDGQTHVTRTITNIQSDITIVVEYEPDFVDFQVEHYWQHVADDGYDLHGIENISGFKTGDPVGTFLEKDYTGFDNLVYDSTVTVAADGSTVVKIYYDREYFMVSLDLKGGHGAAPIYARYGTPITISNPQRTGYTFAGWSPSLPATVPAAHTDYTAQWTEANANFSVAFWYENANDQEYTFMGSVQKQAKTGTKVNGANYKDERYSNYQAEYAKHFTYERADSNIEVKADGSTVVNVYFKRNTYTLTFYEFECQNGWHFLSAYYKCGCTKTNQSYWNKISEKTYKYEQNIGEDYANITSGERWVPGQCAAYPGAKDFGDGDAVGTLSTMPGGNAEFYRKDNGSTKYTITFQLETYDGTGTAYNNHYFKAGDKFTPTMGGVNNSDYTPGIPAGFKRFDGHEMNNSGNSYNFYYLRKTFVLEYYNGSQRVTTTTMKFQEPLKGAHNLQNLSMTSPYGAGYTFAGWYLDPGCTIKEDFDGNTIMPNAGNEGNVGLALYAKWEPVTYKVTTHLTKGGTKLGEYAIRHGEALSQSPNDPVRNGYDFIAWFYEENGEEKAYDFSMPAYRNMELYAKWSSDTLVSGYIYYKDTEGNVLADPTEVKGAVGATKTYNAKLGSALNKVTGDVTYFPNVTSHSIVFGEQNAEQNSYTFVYTAKPEVGYTVHFVDKNDTTKSVATTVTGTSKSASITFDLIEKGIVVEDNYVADAMSKTFALSSDSKLNKFYFYFTYDPGKASVQVEHYIETLDGTYTLYFTEPIRTETVGSNVSAEYKTITGFTGAPGVSGTVNNKVLPDAGIVLKLYYARNTYPYIFRFVYRDAGGNEHEFSGSAVSGTGKYGDTVYHTAKSFAGYDLAPGTAGSMSVTISAENPAADANTRTFYYVEETVTINYQVGRGGGGAVSPQTEDLLAVSGESKGSEATPVSSDYTFIGWYTTYTGTADSLFSTSPNFKPTKNSDGVFENDTYYAIFGEAKVTINYALVDDSGTATLSTDSEMVSKITGIAGGSTVIVPNGYKFEGWYDNAECAGDPLSTSAFYRPPRPYDSDSSKTWIDGTTFYAKVVVNEATINYVSVGSGTVSPDSEKVLMLNERAIGSVATAEVYSTFVGWYDNAECSGTPLSTANKYVPVRPDAGWSDETTYYAKFENEDYSISYELNGGTLVTEGTGRYSYGETLTLPIVTKADADGNYYKLTWTVKESAGNWTKNEVITNGTLNRYGNVTLVANWTITAIWIKESFALENLPNFAGTPSVDELKAIDGVLDAQQLPYGEAHVYNGSILPGKTGYDLIWTHLSVSLLPGYVIYQESYAAKQYTIRFVNYDGSELQSSEWGYGDMPQYTGATPTKPADAQYTYTFKGWNPKVDEVTGNQTYTATYTETVNRYTINFINENGDVLQSSEWDYGSTPVYSGETPTKDRTTQYTYEFTGWDPEVETVTGDATYVAQFSSTVNKYIITFVDEDGTELQSSEVEYGNMPVYSGEKPVKEATVEFTYTFLGWDPEVVPVTGPATYKVRYGVTKNKYTITFVDEDGTELQSSEVEYGKKPVYSGETPIKPATAQYTYTFADWTPEIVPVTGDAVYTATYDSTVNKYTITFVDEDSTVLQGATEYDYGTPAADIVKPANPTKSKVGYTYEFNGWDPAVEDVTRDVTYRATYSETVNNYTITYVPGDDAVMPDGVDNTYTIEESIELPEPTKTGYTFNGWKVTTANGNWEAEKEYPADDLSVDVGMHGNVTLTALWTANTYTVVFVGGEGATGEMTSQSFTYDVEQKLTANAFSKLGYTFDGWNTQADGKGTSYSDEETVENLTATANGVVTLHAQWKEAYADLKITAICRKDKDQTFIYVISGEDTVYGDFTLTIAIPAGETVTIKDLPVGKYSVVEKGIKQDEDKGWNWRYANQSVSFDFSVAGVSNVSGTSGVSATPDETHGITFTYTGVENNQWLNDYSRWEPESNKRRKKGAGA